MNAPTHTPLRILLADDHPIFRIGLRAVIQQDPGLTVVGEASTPLEVTQWLAEGECDLLITDFMMPAENQNDGLRLLETIRRHWPDLPILVVTMLSNPGLFREMLALGVKGVLNKASLVSELPIAIAHVQRQKVFIAESISQALLQDGEVRPDKLLERDPLSPRELEVTRLLAGGLSVSEIAAQLNRSKQTVSAQKVNAMRKLGVPNDAALFIYLQEHGLS
ncbi:MAG: response regulator transcription factor [Pseudomonas sp.]|uniref:response regulator transcription factor n=1 Tax=Pseudomonas abieticivorans TaxID=2931382 RepID=UPI0020C02E1D|nr:response regulator transcription factor [Pseudomonas sp. PIA16]MDE1166056.1 response regulator transcription factor [Pseudomonas sp.]